MNEEQTKQLSEYQREIICLLADIADAEKRLDTIKRGAMAIYERSEDALNGE